MASVLNDSSSEAAAASPGRDHHDADHVSRIAGRERRHDGRSGRSPRAVIIGAKFYLLQGFTSVGATTHPEYDELVATFQTI